MAQTISGDLIDVLRDAIGALETRLLAYEQTGAAAPDSSEDLFKLASAIYQLKGKLRRADRPAAAMLFQGLETMVNCHRKRAEPLSLEAVDTLLGALDTVTEDLQEPREYRQRIDAFADRVQALIDDQQLTEPSEKLRPFPFNLNATEQARAKLAQERGECAFVVEKVIPSTLDLATYNNLSLYEPFRFLGRIIAVRPAFADLDRSRLEVVVQIVATAASMGAQLGPEITDDAFCAWPSLLPEDSVAQPSPAPEHPVPLKDSRRRRVLIVEDEFVSRSLLLALLSSYGTCDVAVDGREAVAAVTQAMNEHYPYALICLDIMMPDMDGHQALEGIRKVEAVAGVLDDQHAKVVMTTALSDYANIHRAYQGSCDSYIVKPISMPVLARQLRRIGLTPLT
jgi:two-component system, chemotaxis family, chemotaxis protein CheY